jgi:hypothetical protein
MNKTQVLTLSLIIRRRARAARAFSSVLTPRVHIPRTKGIEASRSASSAASAGLRA